jgi:hypothetical protein
LSTVTKEAFPMDVHDETLISGVYGRVEGGTGAVLIEGEGQDQLRLDEDELGVEPFGRLSADGSFMLAPTSSKNPYGDHAAAIADVRSGALWHLPPVDSYPWIAWSYGDLALVLVDPEGKKQPSLVACDAVTHACDTLPHQGRVLMPAS